MTILYTHAFNDLNSSLVTDVWYDNKTQTAYLSLNEEVYQYDNVPFSAIEELVQAKSIGRAYNGHWTSKGFKQNYGPGTYVGYWSDLKSAQRAAEFAPGRVDKNLTYAPDAKVDNGPVRVSLSNPVTTGDATVRVSLAPVVEMPKAEETEFTVHFESNGAKTYKVKATSWQDAVAKLDEAADMLGVDAKVTGVFVHLV